MHGVVLTEKKGEDFHLCVEWNLHANLIVRGIHQLLCKAAVIIPVITAKVCPPCRQGEDKVGFMTDYFSLRNLRVS